MKKIYFTILLFIGFHSFAQLSFDKRFVECEDKWVAFPADSTAAYIYGFVYIDEQAGLTLDYSGDFIIDSTGKLIANAKEKTSSLKVRLEPNNTLVAIIPESNFDQLQITKVPDWLKDYKTNEGSIERLYKWGFMYNGWNECIKALEFLEKASKINSDFKDLSVELAYSYNCLNQYEKAITVLQKALLATPTDAYVNKEYIYALAKNDQIDSAIDNYRKFLKISTDKTYLAENAFTILQRYFIKKDIKNFEKWLAETETTISSNTQMKNIIGQMKIEINNK